MLIYSKVNWVIKSLASLGAILVFVFAFNTLQSSYGWPYVSEDLPEFFEVKWIDIEEPTLDDKGSIRLWVKEWKQNAIINEPRAFELPYTKEQHKESNDAIKKLMSGQKVFGQNKKIEGGGLVKMLEAAFSGLLEKLGFDGEPAQRPGGDGGDTQYAKNTRDQNGWDFIEAPTRTPPKDIQE